MRQAGATPHRGARASHCRGLSCCGAQAPDAQAQQLWLTGPVAPRHVGSSQTRARTRVPCIGRQILNHCATREALFTLYSILIYLCVYMCVCIYMYICVYIYILFHSFFHYRFLQGFEYSSLCYTVGPCSLSILYIVVFIC